jgi:hypothetical protein
MALAQGIGRTGIILGIKAVILLLQPILGRFSGIDGAADQLV